MSNIQYSINSTDEVIMTSKPKKADTEPKSDEIKSVSGPGNSVNVSSQTRKKEEQYLEDNAQPSITQQVVEGFRKWTFGETEHNINEDHGNFSDMHAKEALKPITQVNSDSYRTDKGNYNNLTKNSNVLPNKQIEKQKSATTNVVTNQEEVNCDSGIIHPDNFKDRSKISSLQSSFSKDHNREKYTMNYSQYPPASQNYEKHQLVSPIDTESHKSLVSTERTKMKSEKSIETAKLFPDTNKNNKISDNYYTTMDPWRNNSDVENHIHEKNVTEKPTGIFQTRESNRIADKLKDKSKDRQEIAASKEGITQNIKFNPKNVEQARNISPTDTQKQTSSSYKNTFGHKEKQNVTYVNPEARNTSCKDQSAGKNNDKSARISHSDRQFVPENDIENTQKGIKEQSEKDKYDNFYVGTVDDSLKSQCYGLSKGPYLTNSKEKSTSYKQNENLMHSKKEILQGHQDNAGSQNVILDGDNKNKKIIANTNLSDVSDKHGINLNKSGESQHIKRNEKSRRNSMKDKILNVFGIHKKQPSKSEEDYHNYSVEDNYSNTKSGAISQPNSLSREQPNISMSHKLNSTANDFEKTTQQAGNLKNDDISKSQESEKFQKTTLGTTSSSDNHHVNDILDQGKGPSQNNTDMTNAEKSKFSNNDADKLPEPSSKRHKQSNSVSDSNEAALQRIKNQQNENSYQYQEKTNADNHEKAANIPRSSQVLGDMHIQDEKAEDRLNYISTSSANIYINDT